MISNQDATDSQIEANPKFEVWFFRAQTVLQWLIGAVILAGVLGAFGEGWLSTETRSFPDLPLTVTYQRFLRASKPTNFELKATAPLSRDTLDVGVGSELLKRAWVNITEPGSVGVRATTEGLTYTFRLGAHRDGVIILKVSAQRVGPVDAVLTAEGKQLTLPLFVYP
ncbi:hypothetical protein ACRAWG_12140 [Methylobacterium sp. P31]